MNYRPFLRHEAAISKETTKIWLDLPKGTGLAVKY